MKLSREVAKELIYSKTSPDALGFEREAVVDEGTGRWESHHSLILRDSAGRFWAASYSQGLTESQDSHPFEDDPDEIEFHEVEKVPVITYEYRDVKPGDGGVREPSGDNPDSPAPGEPGVPGGSDGPGALEATGDAAFPWVSLSPPVPWETWPVLPVGTTYKSGDSFRLWMEPDGTWHQEILPATGKSEAKVPL